LVTLGVPEILDTLEHHRLVAERGARYNRRLVTSPVCGRMGYHTATRQGVVSDCRQYGGVVRSRGGSGGRCRHAGDRFLVPPMQDGSLICRLLVELVWVRPRGSPIPGWHCLHGTVTIFIRPCSLRSTTCASTSSPPR